MGNNGSTASWLGANITERIGPFVYIKVTDRMSRKIAMMIPGDYEGIMNRMSTHMSRHTDRRWRISDRIRGTHRGGGQLLWTQ